MTRLHPIFQDALKSFAPPAVSYENPIWHGKWRIYPTDPLPPIPTWRQFAWSFVHDDYDGAPDANDHRHGYAPTVEACRMEIEMMEEEDG